jgi:protein ImuA
MVQEDGSGGCGRSAEVMQRLQGLGGRWPLWRGHELGRAAVAVVPTGFEALDAVLPGGGWPTGELTELVGDVPLSVEHRLLAPALARHTRSTGPLVLVGPPCRPMAGAWAAAGVDERRLLWVDTRDARQTAWVLAQCLQAGQSGWLMAWLPDASASVLRRLQVLTVAAGVPCVVWRPASARAQASAAPLRLQVWAEVDWQLRVQVFKRRGPPMEEPLHLRVVPAALQPVLTHSQGRGMASAPGTPVAVPVGLAGHVPGCADAGGVRDVVAGTAAV